MLNLSLPENMLNDKKVLVGGVIAFFVFLAGIFLIGSPSSTPQLQMVAPGDGSANVGLLQEIKFRFPNPLSKAEKEKVVVTLSPASPGSTQWEEGNQELTFISKEILLPSTKYKASLSYQNKAFSFNFTTMPAENVSLEDQRKIQSRADKKTGEWWANIQKKYPWYSKLPAITDNYFIYFDLGKEAFVIKLYTHSDPNMVSRLKEDALSALSKLGINPSSYEIVWEVK